MYQKPYTCTEINVLLHFSDLRALILRNNDVRGPTFPEIQKHFNLRERSPGASPASRDRGGEKLKSGGKGFRRFPKAFSGRNQKSSDQKLVISKKKKVFTEIQRLFLSKSQILTFLPPKKSNFFLPKKYRGGRQEKNPEGKNENRGGSPLPPPPPRWRRAWRSQS